MNLIECIDHYFEDTKSHMDGLLENHSNQDESDNNADYRIAVVWYYKCEIIYNISKIEIHCRALRDKLENG